jgi:hypothetical protein
MLRKGCSVADTVLDNEHLRDYFAGKYGEPAQAYLSAFAARLRGARPPGEVRRELQHKPW